MFDTVIKGGTIVDGLGGAPFVGDIAFRDGVIAEVGGSIDGAAREVLDAGGAHPPPTTARRPWSWAIAGSDLPRSGPGRKRR